MQKRTLVDLEGQITRAEMSGEGAERQPPAWLSDVLANSGDPIAAWDRCAKVFTFDFRLWGSYGHALFRHGRLRDALAAYQRVEACGRPDEASNALGRVYSRLEDWPAALRCWFKGMEHSRDEDQRLAFLHRRAETYFRLGALDDALADFSQVRSARPYSLSGHYGVVRALCELRAFEAAAEAASSATMVSVSDRCRLEILLVRSTGGRNEIIALARRLADLDEEAQVRSEMIRTLLHNRSSYFSQPDLDTIRKIGTEIGFQVDVALTPDADDDAEIKLLEAIDPALLVGENKGVDAVLARAKATRLLVQLGQLDEARDAALAIEHDVESWPATPRVIAEIIEWGQVERGNWLQAQASYWARRSKFRSTDRRHELALVSDSLDPGDVIVFSQMRNEQFNLADFLGHHRRMGASGFVIVDNGSTDGSAEYLSTQPDVRLFATSCSYRRARAGADWLDPMARSSEFANKLCLRLDADERIVFPHCETRSLTDLRDYMIGMETQALRGILVDLYPVDLNKLETTNHFTECRYFDSNFRTRPSVLAPYREITGGVRARALSGKRQTLGKVPGILGGSPVERLGSHRTSPTTVTDVTCALLHYKFRPGFFQKAIDEESRKEYAQNGQEWSRYSELQGRAGASLVNQDSHVYSSWRDLLERGIINTSVGWDEWPTDSARHPR